MQGQGGQDLMGLLEGMTAGGFAFHESEGIHYFPCVAQPALYVFVNKGRVIASFWDGAALTELVNYRANATPPGVRIELNGSGLIVVMDGTSSYRTRGAFLTLLLG